MSAVAFLIAVAIAVVATLLYAAIRGVWDVRELAALFVALLVVLVGPAFLHG